MLKKLVLALLIASPAASQPSKPNVPQCEDVRNAEANKLAEEGFTFTKDKLQRKPTGGVEYILTVYGNPATREGKVMIVLPAGTTTSQDVPEYAMGICQFGSEVLDYHFLNIPKAPDQGI